MEITNTVNTVNSFLTGIISDTVGRGPGCSTSRGKTVFQMDMSHTYQQILRDDDLKKHLTVNTHRGLYTYNRLPFGVASAPAIFQRTMEGLLRGIL